MLFLYIRDVVSVAVESWGPSSGTRGDDDVGDSSLSIYQVAPKDAKSFLAFETRLGQRLRQRIERGGEHRGEVRDESRNREWNRERGERNRENGERSAETLARWLHACRRHLVVDTRSVILITFSSLTST